MIFFSLDGLDRFVETKSSTYKSSSTKFSIEYGDGSTASGHLAQDTVSIAGLTIKNQIFADVTDQGMMKKALIISKPISRNKCKIKYH